MHRLATFVFGAAVVAGGLVPLTAGVAMASTNPYVGHDPTVAVNGVVCATGAYAVDNAYLHGSTAGGPQLHLMYSPRCNTNWAEVDTFVEPVDIIVWNVASNGADTWYQHNATYNIADYGSYGYTKMVDGTNDAGACARTDHAYYCLVQTGAANTIPSGADW